MSQSPEQPEEYLAGELSDDQVQGEPEVLPSWWSCHWPDIVVVCIGILVVGILVSATIVMKLL